MTSFAAVGAGDLGVIVDANGHLALVGDRSSAARTLGLDVADLVTLCGPELRRAIRASRRSGT